MQSASSSAFRSSRRSLQARKGRAEGRGRRPAPARSRSPSGSGSKTDACGQPPPARPRAPGRRRRWTGSPHHRSRRDRRGHRGRRRPLRARFRLGLGPARATRLREGGDCPDVDAGAARRSLPGRSCRSGRIAWPRSPPHSRRASLSIASSASLPTCCPRTRGSPGSLLLRPRQPMQDRRLRGRRPRRPRPHKA